jgi:hypothetical protein
MGYLLRELGTWIVIPAAIGAGLTWLLAVRRVAVAVVVDPNAPVDDDDEDA